ncbi:ABC transporter substrate-binding protein [Terasakiella sp. SH-1]|uniref:ABC transporter substrate-binding protein n=1 Tax=Terasakiella sp. SH-1 TaxID=2560057 RepID=UPI001073BC6D|nr:ABC transporter substrate-binding protein [Terasakiella sp. SH-1]
MVHRRDILKLGAGGVAAICTPSLLHARVRPLIVGDINSYIPSINRFTIPYRKGWILAKEQINLNGGVSGRPLEVFSQNDRGNLTEAVRAAKFLTETKKADVLSGSFLSHIGLALADYAAQNRIPFIAAEPLSDKITLEKGNPYTFRLRPSTYMQTRMLAKEAIKLPVTRWACIAPNYEYGHSAVENFKTVIRAARPDVEFAETQWVDLFKIRPDDVIENLSNKNIDAIFNVTFSTDLEKLVKASEKTKFFQNKSVVSLLSGEPEYLKTLTSPVCDNWIVSGYPWEQIQTHAHRQFVQAYQSRFAESPMLGSLVGYMTLTSIAQAFKNDQAPSSAEKFENLFFDSPLGTIHYRASDHQSSMGTFIGRLHHQNGINRLSDWYYADGADFWPSAEVIAQRRNSE